MSDSLKVDLYQLTMAAAYLRARRNPKATFELFVRRMPQNRGYLLVAGLAQVVEFLQQFRFDGEDLAFLKTLPALSGVDQSFFETLAGLRFTGEIWAMPEGTVAFAGEPLLRVTAPLVEAQLIETYLLSTINFQTLVATKASRVVQAARGRQVVDFGSRRAHGSEAGVLAARAALIGGCVATSNVEAGRRFGMEVAGTMAHSFVMAFSSEEIAFQRYLESFPSRATLLVDTYDTVAGAKTAAGMGSAVHAVRLDSGDLLGLSRKVREELDRAGRKDLSIFASGELNERRIERLLAQGAKLDAFGVGTEMATSQDAPALDGVYKLVELVEPDGRRWYPVKLSRRKETWPGRKQVFRRTGKRGVALSDTVGLADEPSGEETRLLAQVMDQGRPVRPLPGLEEIRQRAVEQVECLPPRYQRLRSPSCYPVTYSVALQKLGAEVRQKQEHLGTGKP